MLFIYTWYDTDMFLAQCLDIKTTHLIISKSLWSDTLMFLARFQER